MNNYYALLGVTPEQVMADPQRLRAGFLSILGVHLAATDPKSSASFDRLKEIFDAFNTLSCADDRARYDELLKLLERTCSEKQSAQYLRDQVLRAVAIDRLRRVETHQSIEGVSRRPAAYGSPPDWTGSPHRQTYFQLGRDSRNPLGGLSRIFRRRQG